MNCQSCRIEIEELELGSRLSGAADAHTETCVACGAFYDERLSLRKLVGSLGPVSVPSDFDFRLRARLAAGEREGNHRFSFRSFIASAPAIGLAASFALLVSGVVVYNQFKTKPAADQPMASTEVNGVRPSEPTVASSPSISGSSFPEVSTAPSPEPIAVPIRQTGNRQSIGASNRASARRASKPAGSEVQIVSHDEAVRPAPQIRPAPGSQFASTSPNQLVELPVRSPAQPVRVFVDDQSGGRRSVTLEPVIFGSQDLTGRIGFRPASSQGIW